MSTFFNNLGSAVSKMLHMNNNEFEDEYDVNDDTLDEDEIEEDEIIEILPMAAEPASIPAELLKAKQGEYRRI